MTYVCRNGSVKECFIQYQVGDRSFSSAATSIWNSLPLVLRCCLYTTTFKSLLRTFLISHVWNDDLVEGFTAP